jgi:pilus assembly protein CpaD
METDLKDDYVADMHYERYPIKVTKQPVKLSISSKQGHITPSQAGQLAMAGRNAHGLSNGGVVSVQKPSGGGKSSAVATEVKSLLLAQGVPANKIVVSTYNAGSTSPVLVSFVRAVAVTEECGSWNNLAYQPNNEAYDNLGCAHQHNIAAMVANPQDLVIPQPMTPIDAGKTSVDIDAYRGYSSTATGGSSGGDSGGGDSGGGDSGGGDSGGGDSGGGDSGGGDSGGGG